MQKQKGCDRQAQQEITRLLLKIRPTGVIVHTLGTLPACLKARAAESPAIPAPTMTTWARRRDAGGGMAPDLS